MAERQAGETRRAQASTDSYIQEVAGRSNPAEQIATAKGLLDEERSPRLSSTDLKQQLSPEATDG
jgi:hypothetical protein